MKNHVIAFLILFFAAMSPLVAQTGTVPADVDSAADARRRLAQFTVNHSIFDRLAGIWKITGQAWLDGFDKKPAKVTGQALHGTWLYSRYLFIHDSLYIRNENCEGVALLGYDNALGHYVMTRGTNQNTALVTFAGAADSALKRLTLETRPADSASAAASFTRIEIRFINGNKFTVETWEVFPNGSALKQRELIYVRIS